MLEFKKFLEQNSLGVHLDGPGGPFNQNHGGAYLSTDQTGSEQIPTFTGRAQNLPGTDITFPNKIPFVKRTSRISFIERNKNPINIRLSDGTQLYLTYDEYKRIKEEPEIGKTMTVIFQRKENDRSQAGSKIERIEVK